MSELPEKPEHAPPHGRYFEDGEEPPERYDLDDELDYIISPTSPWDERRWFGIAGRSLRANWGYLAATTWPYVVVVAFLSVCSCGLLFLLFEPLMRVFPISSCLAVLTGNHKRFGDFSRSRQMIWLLFACRLPAGACWLITFVMFMFRGYFVYSISNPYEKTIISAAIVLAFVVGSLFVQIRLCGFALELVYDHDVGLLEGLRGSWRITGRHPLRFIRLKLCLWLFMVLAGLPTFGFGLLFMIPYANLVWTAAYLDAAGSEEITETRGSDSE